MIGNILSLINNTIKSKQNEYLMFIVGRHPDNIKDGMKMVTDKDSLFRFSVSESLIIIRFSSKKTISEIEKIFNRVYENRIDSYFLYESNSSTQCKRMHQIHHNHLYDEEYFKSDALNAIECIECLGDLINEVNKIQVNVFERIRDRGGLELIADEFETNTNNPKINEKTEISMGDINPILDKIELHGIASLTERENELLKQYAKK
jgi:hypothetical protein